MAGGGVGVSGRTKVWERLDQERYELERCRTDGAPAESRSCHRSPDGAVTFEPNRMSEEVLGLARSIDLGFAATQMLAAAEGPAERAEAAERLFGIAVEGGQVDTAKEALGALIAARRALGLDSLALLAEADLALLGGDFTAHRAALSQLEAGLDPEDEAARAEIADRLDRAVDQEIRDRVERNDLDGALEQLGLRYEQLLSAGAKASRLLHVRELAAEVAARKLASAIGAAESEVARPQLTQTSTVAVDRGAAPSSLDERAAAFGSPLVREKMGEVAAARAELAAWARREVPGDPDAHRFLRRELGLADQLQRAGDLDGARAVLDAAADGVRGTVHHEAMVAHRRLGLELAHGNRAELGRALGELRRTQRALPDTEVFLLAQSRFLEIEAQLGLGTLEPNSASERLFAVAEDLSSDEDPRVALLGQRIRLRAATLTQGPRAESEALALSRHEGTDQEIAAAAGLLATSAALERGDPKQAARRLLELQQRFPGVANGLAQDPRFAPLIDANGRFKANPGALGAALVAALAESGSGPALRTLLFAGVGFAVGGPVGAAAGLALDRAVGVGGGFDHVAGAYATGLSRSTSQHLTVDLLMLGADTATLGTVAAAAIAGRIAGRRLAAHGLRAAGVALGAGPVRGALAAGAVAGEALAGTAAASAVDAIRSGEPFRWRPEDALLWMAGRAAAAQLSSLQWGSRGGESLRQTFHREATLAGQTAAVDVCLRAALAQAGVQNVLPQNLLEHADAQAKALLLVGLLGRGVSTLERAARRADEASARIAADAARPPPPSGPQLAVATVPAGPLGRPPPLSAEAIGRGSLLGQVALRNLDGDLSNPKVRYASENHVDRRLGSTSGYRPEELVDFVRTARAEGWHPNAVAVLIERVAGQIALSGLSLEHLIDHHRALKDASGVQFGPLRDQILDRYRERVQEVDAMPTPRKQLEAARKLAGLAASAEIPVLEAFAVPSPAPPLASLSPEAQRAVRAIRAGESHLDVSSRAVAEEVLTQFPGSAETSFPKSVTKEYTSFGPYDIKSNTHHWDTERGPDGRVVGHPIEPGAAHDHGRTPHLQLQLGDGVRRIHFPWGSN